MVEPRDAAVYLAGLRLRELTPVYAGEEIRVGGHRLLVEIRTADEACTRPGFGAMVGATPVMKQLFGVLSRVAAHDAPVLLTGESGTGKELAARGLHDNGPRQNGPFIAVNCAGIPSTLFESELFGHEKGSFTGATRGQDGAFQAADGGTLFLDEVGELQADAQAKLLRVLESGEVRRVGGGKPEYPDVRVVCATNRDLADMSHQGTFRSDLYFRIAVLSVRLPPLRARREDIPQLAATLLNRANPGSSLTEDGASALMEHEWPGNVRELRNVLTRALVLGGPVISATSLSFDAWAFDGAKPAELTAEGAERAAVEAALADSGGNRSAAARALGIPRSSLLYKIKRLGIKT